MSVAVTKRSGRSCLSDSATAPLPVPTSTTRDSSRKLEAGLDEDLGVRPGDQHARVHVQLEEAERLAPEDVGHRLAPLAASHERVEARRLAGLQPAGGAGDEAGAVGVKDLGEQYLGVEAGGVAPRGGQAVGGARQRVADGVVSDRHVSAACASSARRRSSASSAPVSSSSSPPSTFSTLWTVRFTRWSVMRSCGKL